MRNAMSAAPGVAIRGGEGLGVQSGERLNTDIKVQ
jgi:hypothetical protein